MGFISVQAAIKQKLSSIDKIQEVHDYPTEDFNGYPAVMIAAKKNESDFETTAENLRTYFFKLVVMHKVGDQADAVTIKKAREVLMQTVDAILTAFDTDQTLQGINLSSDETMIICKPGLTDEIVSDPPYVIANMQIRAQISINIT